MLTAKRNIATSKRNILTANRLVTTSKKMASYNSSLAILRVQAFPKTTLIIKSFVYICKGLV